MIKKGSDNGYFLPILMGWIRPIKGMMSARVSSKKGSRICKWKNDIGRKENKQQQMLNSQIK